MRLNKETNMASRGTKCFLTVTRKYSSSVDKNVGFLGLGNMGCYMAANLVKKVHEIVKMSLITMIKN